VHNCNLTTAPASGAELTAMQNSCPKSNRIAAAYSHAVSRGHN